ICMRIKIYNKVVCQLESPGVAETFGSHLLNMVFQGKDLQLLRTFHDERVQKRGVSRIECTFYGKVPKREKLPEYFVEMEGLFLPACKPRPLSSSGRLWVGSCKKRLSSTIAKVACL